MDDAALIGELVAKAGWAVLTGGTRGRRDGRRGEGARSAGGLTIGILPTPDTLGASPPSTSCSRADSAKRAMR
jgi:predicted Rossmann-fold nucleotide-binding protein